MGNHANAVHTATPKSLAIERIKRKATGLASAAAAEFSDADDLDARSDPEQGSFAPRVARKCRCAKAEIKAYRDGAEWWCHTCGYELSVPARGHRR